VLIRVMLMIGVMLKKVGGRLPAGAVEKMNYGPPGKAVLCQGSEILHHVTPVRSSVPRIVVILCFAPADVFKSPLNRYISTYQ